MTQTARGITIYGYIISTSKQFYVDRSATNEFELTMHIHNWHAKLVNPFTSVDLNTALF
jgi:hypothetical protein